MDVISNNEDKMRIKEKNVSLTKLNEGKLFDARPGERCFFLDTRKVKIPKGFIHLSFHTNNTEDNVKLCFVNSKMKILFNFDSNTDTYLNIAEDFSVRLMIKTDAANPFTLEKLIIEPAKDDYLSNYLHSGNLLICSDYPVRDDKHNGEHVRDKVAEYKAGGFDVDVVWVCDVSETTIYRHKGYEVIRLGYGELRELLYLKEYKRILTYFFNERIAKVFENLDLDKTLLYFFPTEDDVLYRDCAELNRQYFEPKVKITGAMRDAFEEKDRLVSKYNEMPNVRWIFDDERTRHRSEELTGIKFKNSVIIPKNINAIRFCAVKKTQEHRKKILIIKDFDGDATHAVDTDVRTVLELAGRKFFSDLEFSIYGDGPLHDMLLAPLAGLPNVRVYKKTVTSDEAPAIFAENGIFLCASRYGKRPVLATEAAISGCAVIDPNFLKGSCANPESFNPESHKEYADAIERLYNSPESFLALSEKTLGNSASEILSSHPAIPELEIYENDGAGNIHRPALTECSNPILSVVIPAYNVQKYIRHTLRSLINQKNAGKIEILVINDGSRDDTYKVAYEYAEAVDKTGKIIRIINKENGGHGSVLNRGVEEANGKYLKIVDGDDTVNSKEFEKLIDYLEGEDCDIVLNNFCEDVPYENRITPCKYYNMLSEGVEYNIGDLCFENYGFGVWGPLLSTSTYKLDMIKRRPFVTTEKMAYDDMEWNLNVCINCNTVKYYDFNVYNYLIGRAGQSISPETLMRKYPVHRQMVSNLLKIYKDNFDGISQNKRVLIEKTIIKKMIKTHYELIYSLIKLPSAFRDFDDEVRPYGYFYNHPEIARKKTRFFRATKGRFMFLQNLKFLKK